MIKSELIEKIHEKMPKLTPPETARVVNILLGTISDTLLKKKRVEIRGFGSFATKVLAPREAHNPKTGEKINKGNTFRIHFKAGKRLRENLQQGE